MAKEATADRPVATTLDGAIRIDLPAAGLWALICMVLAVVQIDTLLVLGFKLFQAWLTAEKQANAESAARS